MEIANNGDYEITTLFLQNKRFEVNKDKLVKKSEYFAAALSANCERHQSQHVINYTIDLIAFQSFIKWVHDDKLENCIEGDNDKIVYCLLELLKLSIFFTVDELIDDIIRIIEERYLLLNYVIDIWLVAEELNIFVLEMICFAVCIDRFDDLLFEYIGRLSKKNFLKLITDINLRYSDSCLKNVLTSWNVLTLDKLPETLLQKTESKMSSNIVSSENFRINNQIYLHYWDGTKLDVLDKFWFPKDFPSNKPNDVIKGIQVTGRGCYLYFIGGEVGVGSESYNTNIWRYSLLTKKWLRYATMPTARKCMITVFIGSKLVLAGGIGRSQQQLDSVDVYDVHTNTWSYGAIMPFTFTNVPAFCVCSKKVVVCNNFPILYVYCPNKNIWNTLKLLEISKSLSSNVLPIMLPLRNLTYYIDLISPSDINVKGLILLNHEFRSSFKTANATCTLIQCGSKDIQDDIIFCHGKTLVEESEIDILLLCSYEYMEHLRNPKYKYYFYNSIFKDSDNFHSLCNTSNRSFNLINPVDFHASTN